MLNDKRISTETEELLGSRNPKSGRRAVRWDDLTNATLVNTLKGAGIGGGSSGGSGEIPEDLEERLENVEGQITSAFNAANNAADTSQNALLAAEGAVSQVESARDDAAQMVEDLRSDLNAEYTDAKAAAAMQLPSTFEQGKTFWTDQREGSPATIPDTAFGTPVNEPGFGWVMRMAWNATGRNLMTKGVVTAPAEKIIRVTARFVVRSFNIGPSIDLNIAAVPLDAEYLIAPEVVTTASQAFEVGTTIHQITGTFAAVAGEGVETVIAAMATAQFMRFGIRQEQNGIAEIDFLSLSVRDVTYEVRAQRFATAANLSSSAAFTYANNASTSAGAADESRLQAAVSANDANESATQADLSRQDAVFAKEDAEAARAGAETTLTLTAQIGVAAKQAVAITFPKTMEGNGQWWSQSLDVAPPEKGGLSPHWTYGTAAVQGPYIEAATPIPGTLSVAPIQLVPNVNGRRIRIRWTARHVGAFNGVSASAIQPQFRTQTEAFASGGLITVIAPPGGYAFTQTDVWQTFSVEAVLNGATPWVLPLVYVAAGRMPDGVQKIQISTVEIEDITAQTQANNFAAAAELARSDAVVAQQDAEEARAGAESALTMSAEVAGQGFSCLNDTLLVSSDWGRYSGQGTRTLLDNVIYPIGRTWQFNVTAAQVDGIQLIDSPATIWIGQTNAQAYVVEVMFTLLSGTLSGAGVRVNWRNSAGSEFGAVMHLADMQAGEGVVGRARVARGVFVKPSNFSGTFASMRLFIVANWSGLAPMAAKNIQFHRVNIRPATAEEMGQGQVMNQVQAHLTQNYLTVAETNQAIASFDLATSATLGTGWAAVKQSQTALADLNGSVARFRNMATVDGVNYAGIEAVAFSGAGTGTGTVVKLYGDQVIVPGSLSAREVVVHDGSGNLFPDPQFASLSIAAWTPLTNASQFMVPRKVSDLAAGTIKTNAPAATVLSLLPHGAFNPHLFSPIFEVRPGERFNLAFDAAVVGGGAHDMRLRLAWRNNTGALTGTLQELRVTTAPEGWQRYTLDTGAVPAGVVGASIYIYSVGQQTTTAYLTNFQIVRKRSGAVLITPNSVTAELMNVEQLSAITANVGDLRSFNYNPSTGTGWRITNDGLLTLPWGSIQGAWIGDLTVDTIHLKDAAVSNFYFARQSADQNTGTGGDRALLSISFPASYGDRVLLLASYRLKGSSPNNNLTYNFKTSLQYEAYSEIPSGSRDARNLLVLPSNFNTGTGPYVINEFLSSMMVYNITVTKTHHFQLRTTGNGGSVIASDIELAVIKVKK